MSPKIEQVISEALSLPAGARAFVAERLIESLDNNEPGELSPEWREEVRKRCREIDERLVELQDADDVFKRAFASLG